MVRQVEIVSLSLPRLTVAQVEAAVTGELRILWRFRGGQEGHVLGVALGDADQVAFTLAQERGYVVTEGWCWPLLNAYFLFCDATRRPYVRAVQRGDWTRLELDMVCADWSLTLQAVTEAERLLATVCQDVVWYGPSGCLADVPTGQAGELAKTLFILAHRRAENSRR